MANQERSAWAMVVVSIAAYATYLGIILSAGSGLPLAPADYGWPLLWTIIGAVVIAIATEIGFSIADGARGLKSGRRDERDRRIEQLGEYTGQAFIVIGGIVALILAILEVDQFWIANVIYLAFVVSAVLGSFTKIAFYREGLPTW